jgi:uncharacterized membrane protein YoaK (UPF0700 family)
LPPSPEMPTQGRLAALTCSGDYIAFGTGAAIGEFGTEVSRAYSLTVPVTLLVVVAWLCEQNLKVERSQLPRVG